jgi:UDP-GlcNAc:undecaprenyl-phosphate GlcNAc-1-phosphate transferase
LATFTFFFLISFILSWILSPIVGRAALRLQILDLPNDRKIHTVAVPRIGGVVVASSIVMTILAAVALDWIMAEQFAFDLSRWWPVFAGGAIVFLIGTLDDVKSLPVWPKFLAQTAAALLAIAMGVRVDQISLFGSGTVDLGVLAIPLTFLWIVGITNAFNLVDGLDGLAAGLGSIAAATCAALFVLRGDAQDAGLLMIVLGALLGFLPHNFNPARMYLGDSGSLLTGYFLAVTTIIGIKQTPTALAAFIPLLVLGLPIVDTLFSMFRRVMACQSGNDSDTTPPISWARALKRMFEADRQHFHHRMLEIGFSHRNAVLTLYAVGAILSLFAVLSVVAEYRNAGIILIAVGLAAVIGVAQLDYREARILRIGTLLRWYESSGFDRRFFMGFVDLVVITAAYVGAFVLKFYDSQLTGDVQIWYVDAFPTVLIVQLVCFYLFGLYRGVWRMMDLGDLLKVGAASCAAVAMSHAIVVIADPPDGTTSFFAIDLLLLGFFAGGIRSVYRILDHFFRKGLGRVGTALIYGAGRTGQMVLRELRYNASLNLHPVGFIDDDIQIRNRMINGTPVLGTAHDVREILDDKQVNVMIVSSASTEDSRLMHVVRSCKERGIMLVRAEFQFQPFDQDDQFLLEGNRFSLKESPPSHS